MELITIAVEGLLLHDYLMAILHITQDKLKSSAISGIKHTNASVAKVNN